MSSKQFDDGSLSDQKLDELDEAASAGPKVEQPQLGPQATTAAGHTS